MITFKYYKEQCTLMVKLEGDVPVKDLIHFFDKVENDLHLPRQLNILMDNRSSFTTFSIQDTKLIREAAEKKLVDFKEIRQALIIKSVQGTTSALFYKHISNHSNFYFEVFTTYNAAISWLNLDLMDDSFIKDTT